MAATLVKYRQVKYGKTIEEGYTFDKANKEGFIVIEHYINKLYICYGSEPGFEILDTQVFEDTEEGRAQGNEVYKRLRAEGWMKP